MTRKVIIDEIEYTVIQKGDIPTAGEASVILKNEKEWDVYDVHDRGWAYPKTGMLTVDLKPTLLGGKNDHERLRNKKKGKK